MVISQLQRSGGVLPAPGVTPLRAAALPPERVEHIFLRFIPYPRAKFFELDRLGS